LAKDDVVARNKCVSRQYFSGPVAKQHVTDAGRFLGDSHSRLYYDRHVSIQISTTITMAQDELEEISGIKPKIWLEDGKEHEVGSASRYVHRRCICGQR
jgi:hypothetical protein